MQGAEAHLGGVLVVVAATVEPDADAVGDHLDSTSPDGLVEAGVEEHLLGAHGLASKVLNGLDGGRGAL